ncbi:MAG TPA: hypothetical protein ENI87_02515 [bacterium]|nr:hypothetical protein [bacterium]
MADPLSNAAPVGPVGGFPQRNPRERPQRQPGGKAGSHAQPEPEGDEVSVHGAAQIARRLLRERVLAQTRRRLGLTPGEFVPAFAEQVDDEPIAAFLGRLIGAQNQLAALRHRELPQAELRRQLDAGLRDGIAEVLELLGADPVGGAAATDVVTQVLGDYGRRLALVPNPVQTTTSPGK